MNKKDEIENLFASLQGQFDTEEPAVGHEERFRSRLNARVDEKPKSTRHFVGWAIAASLLLLIGLGTFWQIDTPSKEEQLADLSPEAARTQMYFASLIEEQVRQIESESNPLTRKMISDALAELEQLEKDYQQLEEDLLNGGNSKLLLSAMVTNFQTRIDLLNEVLKNIESIKNLNQNQNEDLTI